MEKTNKYYSVIENLVKQNRKFQGLEAILDDIIDDVYSHSEVIINSINNDGVIQSYLEKVVSTSIITVPKKMGFHPEIKHRTIDAQQVLENVAQRKAEKVNTELVDRMINNIPIENNEVHQETVEKDSEFEELEPETSELMLSEAPKEVEQTTEDNILNFNEEMHEESSDNTLEDFVASDSLEIEDLDEEEPTFETEEPLQESLEVSELNEEPNFVEDTQNDSLELNDLENISLDDASESTATEEIQDLETVETEDIEPIVDADVSASEENIANDDIETIEQSDESLEPMLDFDDLTPADNDLETLEPTDTLDLDLQEDDNSDSLLEAESLDESPLDVINDNGLNQIADVITTTLENPENTSSENTDFKPTDYSVFSYSTDKYKDDIDAEEIVSEIKDLASKHPELNIINVYNLKFKDKLTIPQVASELNMSEDNVIEALNELVAIVQ